ncbi:MAG: ABC transporter ATP-binding protein [Methylococcales bacterium]|nr:ABC transporter ATP-binding protein [Methylococcales bacterium]
MSIPALSVENLSFAYGKKPVLQNLDFAIPEQGCTILLGPNGAGKSTLFALITRLYDSRQGRIAIAGFDVKKQQRKALASLGVVFQQTTLDMNLSVEQNLSYYAALHGLGGQRARLRIRQELERLELFERRKERVAKLNGGHRRRVEIARALLTEPRLLLLDEPTVGLDVHSRNALVSYLHELVKQRPLAIFWATHLIDEIDDQDRLLVLHQGQLKFQGTVPEVLEATRQDSIGDAFFQLT